MLYTDLPASWPLLSLLQLLPLVASLLLAKRHSPRVLGVASLVSLITLGLAITLYWGFDQQQNATTMQYAEHYPIWGALQYHVAVDGVSVLFVLLTAVLGFLCIVFMVFRKQHGTSMLAIVLGVQATLLSLFVTMNLLWFCLVSVLNILLIAYLTKRWSTAVDVMPTLIRFLQFMATGLVLLFAGTLLLGWHFADAHGYWSFDLYDFTRYPIQDTSLATLVFFLLFYGLAIRVPLFPFHGWLPDFIKLGNIAVAPIMMLGAKVGIYGLFRFVLPVTPQAAWNWHWIAILFAVTGVFYAALLALRQQNLRSLLAYAVVSHTGIITIGLFSLHPAGIKGSLLMTLNVGLAIAGLLFMTGLVWQRTRTTNLNRLGKMFDYIPLVGIAFFIAGLAIVGMPGTPGFDAVHFVLEGSIPSFGALVTIAAALGNFIAAGFLLRAFQRVFLSEPEGDTAHWHTHPSELTEKILATTVIVITVTVGFYDAPWLALIEKPADQLAAIFTELDATHTGDEHDH